MSGNEMMDEAFWNGPIHQAFMGALSEDQLFALWELLLVATLADDELTVEERRTLALALAAAPGFDTVVDLTNQMPAELERLYVAFEDDPTALLGGIAARLGDDATRRGAFRTAVQVIKSDGVTLDEMDFVEHIGELLGLEPEIVEFALSGMP